MCGLRKWEFDGICFARREGKGTRTSGMPLDLKCEGEDCFKQMLWFKVRVLLFQVGNVSRSFEAAATTSVNGDGLGVGSC